MQDALHAQQQVRDRILAGGPGEILFCEHPAVYTLGRHGSMANFRGATDDLEKAGRIVRIERGGEVTYHGPGQLLIYPVVRILSIRALVTKLGEEFAAIGREHGARATWVCDPAGVWVETGSDDETPRTKLAACGFHVSRGIVQHGFSFNMWCDLAPWSRISACGIGAQPSGLWENQALAPSAQQFAHSIAERIAACVTPLVRTVGA